MIRILILDDSTTKVKKIIDLINSIPGLSSENIDIAKDLITARSILHSNLYDLLILDLNLPNREGDDPDPTAGHNFVKELQICSDYLIRPFHILGLTEYDEAMQKSDPIFAEMMWRVIKYDPSTTGWEVQLRNKINYLLDSKKSLRENPFIGHEYDLAIVTALQIPELKSILDLSANWKEERPPNDSTIYHTGTFLKAGKSVKVVATSAAQTGMSAASVSSMKLISRFRPKCLIMCGIAAGLKEAKVELGDILIAESSWDHESGKKIVKENDDVFLPDPKNIPLDNSLKEFLQAKVGNNSYLSEIEKDWPGAKPKTSLKAHIGPIASGSAVIANKKIIEDIKGHCRKLIGLDMETYGVFYSAINCVRPKPLIVSIKSACDYADAKKNDDFQEYAAYTSARYAYHFALDFLGK